jgi:CubicO group peptidase (beta-lactamase class C family)
MSSARFIPLKVHGLLVGGSRAAPVRDTVRPMTLRFMVGLSAIALVVGCGGAEPILTTAPPKPTAAPSAPAAAPSMPEQAFASGDPDLAFRDPDRRKKLESAFAAIDAAVADELATQKLASVSVGIVIDGELAHAKGFGFADLDRKNAPDADTIYRIGSITKSFTALALVSLRDEGAVTLDDPLTKWIPEAAKIVYPTRDAPPLTLRQMLTHTAGLPRESDFDFEHDTTEAQVLAAVEKTTLTFAPGTRWMYSNLGYVLLGLTVGRAAHAPLREVVKKRLLAPLGMTSSAYDLEDVDKARLATPYDRGPKGLEPAAHWKVGATAGAGALFSSVRDMARYVAMQLDAYPPRSAKESAPLKRGSIREAHFNAVPVGLQVDLAEAPAKGESLVDASANGYAYGWETSRRCDFPDLVRHNGGMAGYISDVAFFRDHGVGIVVLTNTAPADTGVIVQRIIAALRRSGGMSTRTPALPATFDATAKKLLALYNHWDDAAYRALVAGSRDPREQEELASYQKLHGACTAGKTSEILGPHAARVAWDCERGAFEMEIFLSADDAKVQGFLGRTKDASVPADLKKLADGVAALIGKWDESAFKKLLGKVKRPRDATFRQFEELRAGHRSCVVKSSQIEGFDRSFTLDCAQGSGLTMTLEMNPKDAGVVAGVALRAPEHGACPVK